MWHCGINKMIYLAANFESERRVWALILSPWELPSIISTIVAIFTNLIEMAHLSWLEKKLYPSESFEWQIEHLLHGDFWGHVLDHQSNHMPLKFSVKWLWEKHPFLSHRHLQTLEALFFWHFFSHDWTHHSQHKKNQASSLERFLVIMKMRCWESGWVGNILIYL